MLSLFWRLCTVLGLVSLVACLALVVACTWCFVLEPRLYARRRYRTAFASHPRAPRQRPYRRQRARAS